MRKVIQFHFINEKTKGNESALRLYVLCDDGSIWRIWTSFPGIGRSDWEKLPDVPLG
jgi:hypothetical protein